MYPRVALSLAVLATVSVVPSTFAATYRVQNLGSKGDPSYGSSVAGIDTAGRVYGTYFDSDYVPHGYRTQVGGTLDTADDVGGFTGTSGDGLFITTVNANGQFGGYGYDNGDALNVQGVAFRSAGSGSVSSSSRIASTGFTLQSQTNAVSTDGRAAGFYQASDGSYHGFRTAANGLVDASTDVGTLGGTETVANGVNANGTAVGYSYLSGNSARHAFVTAGGQSAPIDLGTLGGTNSTAIAIGSGTRVVGNSDLANGHTHAFAIPSNSVLQKTSTADLGTLGGDNSYALGIDATADRVVGRAQTAAGDYHAFLWTRTGIITGTMVDLNTLIPANSGWVLTSATGINASGQIVGTGTFMGQSSAFLLTVPEPTALALVGVAGFALLRRRGKTLLTPTPANG